ncbi:MAG TPA: hypothetical protein DIS76_01975 [Rhodospirillaceae bacterium]|nr:hypothetical protein [Rhodospirillaceae bacterium]
MKRIQGHCGFSMIETIAVLVVAGLVIGGIWMAYSSVHRKSQSSLQEKQISDILMMARDYLQQHNETATPTIYNINGTPRDITIEFLDPDKNLLPGSVRPGTTANTIDTEFAIVRIWSVASAGNPYGTGPLIRIMQSGVAQKDCLDIINTWAGSPDRIQSSGMVGSFVNESSNNSVDIDANNMFNDIVPPDISVTPTQIEAKCNAPSNSIVFLFRLNN